LLAAIAAGDRCAFKALYDATSGKMFGIALLLLRSREAAEDALQEAYLRVWRKARLYDPERGPVLPWLAQILRNAAIDRHHRQPVAHESIDEHADTLAAAAVAIAERTDLARCLDTLSDVQRSAVLLTFLHGYTHDELAKARRVPPGTVKSWVRRGAERLKTCLEQ
jgi:RNA polymerase sigma-70 factor (ECF subfamily)